MAILCAGAGGAVPSTMAASWPPVSAVDWSAVSLQDFADHELEVPRFLHHFAQVANAVVESGPERGYFDLKVNRPPAENQPYNARIMEMQMALAYFYGADRPWNPYFGDPAVRVRLEAMLARWVGMPNGDGLFAEYSPTNWSLAPTAFGAMAAAQALELIVGSGNPFDATILAGARDTLRKALMATFTRSDLRNHGRQWSNQYSPSYYAALTYLRLWPDAVLEAAFGDAFHEAMDRHMSPVGAFYEQGGPDFGYSGVHERNMAVALPELRRHPALLARAIAAEELWADWLAANSVPRRPFTAGLTQAPLFVNAGINTRTGHAAFDVSSRPFAEFVEQARAFSLTDGERAQQIAAARQSLAASWGQYAPLSVPNAESYRPAFVYEAVRPLFHWHPTAAERSTALDRMPALDSERPSVNRQYRDEGEWPLTVTLMRRPTYLAHLNSDRRRVDRQKMGLGLLWNEDFGVLMQSVGGTAWAWGTRRAGSAGLYEEADLADFRRSVGGVLQGGPEGVAELPDGDLFATYTLPGHGEKRVRFRANRVDVEVVHAGAFTEQIPLFHRNAVVLSGADRITLRQFSGASAALLVHTPAAIQPGAPAAAHGQTRRMATLSANGFLSYSLLFGEDFGPAAVAMERARHRWTFDEHPGILLEDARDTGGPGGASFAGGHPDWSVVGGGGLHLGSASGETLVQANALLGEGLHRQFSVRYDLSWRFVDPIPPLNREFFLVNRATGPNDPEGNRFRFAISNFSAGQGGGGTLQLSTTTAGFAGSTTYTHPVSLANLSSAPEGSVSLRVTFVFDRSTPLLRNVVAEYSVDAGSIWIPLQLGSEFIPYALSELRDLRLHAKGNFDEGNFFRLDAITVSRVDDAPHPYLEWAAGFDWVASAADPSADPDEDGVSNLLEFALGGDPLRPFSAAPPNLASTVGGDRLALSFLRARHGVDYFVEGSADLLHWETIARNPGLVGATVTVEDPHSLTIQPSRFLRLLVRPSAVP